MKIFLVSPPVPETYHNREFYVPLGLLYLAAVLQKNGDEVKILDLKCPKYEHNDRYKHFEEILIDAIALFKPDIIGFGCVFSGNFPDILKFSKTTKSKFNDIPIVLGGIHPTIYPYEILDNCPSIDWIVIGEGEESIIQLVDTIKKNMFEFEKIDGFAYRKNGKIFVNPKRHFIQYLDTIPFPAYNLINIEDYYIDTSNWHNPKKLPINTSLPIITSRSCPNRCNFCSMYTVMGPRWRARSPENVVDEIEYLYNRFNHRHFSIMDDNFSLNKNRVLEICGQIIKRNLNIQFETPNGLSINTLDEEVLDALVSAGMVRTGLAIESGSDFIRNKIIRKNLSREKIYEVAKLVKKYKQLNVAAFFIIGMPEETKETLEDTYKMIKDIDVDRVYLMNLVPFPGTEVFKQSLRDDLLLDADPKNLYLANDRYLTNYDQIFLKPYNLTVQDLKDARAKCEELIAVKKSAKKKFQGGH